MANLSEIIAELEHYKVPSERANQIAAELLAIGANAAVMRKETTFDVAHVEQRRREADQAYQARCSAWWDDKAVSADDVVSRP